MSNPAACRPTRYRPLPLALLVLAPAAACDEPAAPPHASRPAGIEARASLNPASQYTAPHLKWVMWKRTSQAVLSKLDLTTNVVSITKVLTYNALNGTWTPVSVAGNKMLWTRRELIINAATSTAELWTLDDLGNVTRRTTLIHPRGYTAVSVAVVDDADCPAPIDAYRHYYVLFYKAGNYPEYWELDDQGVVLGTHTLQLSQPGYTPRDFRRGSDYYTSWWPRPATFRLLWTSNTDNRAVVMNLDLTGTGTVLDVDSYGPANPNDPSDPLYGHYAMSLQLAQDVASDRFGDNMLWSKSDGVGKLFSVNYDGTLRPNPIPVKLPAPWNSVMTAGSLAGADIEDLICDRRPWMPPGENDFDIR